MSLMSWHVCTCDHLDCPPKKSKASGKNRKVRSGGDSARSSVKTHSSKKRAGAQVAHSTCVKPPPSVPSQQGWLWNASNTCISQKVQQGWKPGAIGRRLCASMRESLDEIRLRMADERRRVTRTMRLGEDPHINLTIERDDERVAFTVRRLSDAGGSDTWNIECAPPASWATAIAAGTTADKATQSFHRGCCT